MERVNRGANNGAGAANAALLPNVVERPLTGDDARDLAEHLLRTYFQTQDYPYTRHHIESYDQFLSQDIPAILKSQNPILILQNQIGTSGKYAYKAEIFLGGVTGDRIYIGTPTVTLKDSEEVRVLFPNEARLRNLTYSAVVEADIQIRVTFTKPGALPGKFEETVVDMNPEADPTKYGYLARFPLARVPIMLHSRYCSLHGKPAMFLKDAGECPYDHGGYFIIGGSEKVLITRQEQAFNVLNLSKQDEPYDPQIAVYGSIACLNPTTRVVKRVAMALLRRPNTIQVSLPFVRKPVPLFIVFRAMGIQSDEDIVRTILPDPDSAEAKMLEPELHESILEAHPFLDTFAAIQYIKVLTKGFSEAHVLDVLHNQTFTHVADLPGARAAFLGECVRQILRVKLGIDSDTDRDSIRNQRCLTSGVLTRMLFQGAFTRWMKGMVLSLDKEYNYQPGIYQDMNFLNLFTQGSITNLFQAGLLTEGVMRGFKGKWSVGGGAAGEKDGVLQALSRLSYLDFMSHCRRVVLDFDTGMKLQPPRRLHTSQYGYFCTNETPGGASIGVNKNLSMLTAISTYTEPGDLIKWLFSRGGVLPCDQVTPASLRLAVPVYVNAGIIGYTLRPALLRDALRRMKWTGCLPAAASVTFSIRDRRLLIFLDEGRPLRPLIHLDAGGSLPVAKLRGLRSWRDLVLGTFALTARRSIVQNGFVDPLAAEAAPTLERYVEALTPFCGAIEYMDPYEMNEAYVANYPENIREETSHMEVHPSTIVGLLVSMIPFAHHNQSPRNQLSCSQSKQGISVFATNYPHRFDNQAYVQYYTEAPLVRTLYYDYLAEGQMGYGTNLVLAMGSFSGYNQDDGIVMNGEAIQRGMFRTVAFRSYEAYEEDDPRTRARTRIGNPAAIPGWTALRPGVDYTKLDERGIIREGEYVDENTVVVGRYIQSETGDIQDASVTAQVWTTGRVEKSIVVVNNGGLAMARVRVTQDRIPELGDKFSNRHGQKGTIGMFFRGHDLPRTADGLVVDMIMNPHALPSRMTVAQLLEALLGKACPGLGAVGNATIFMNDGDPSEQIATVLRDVLGLEPMGEELMYDGTTGVMIPTKIFTGYVYTMRLKHLVEDKWNARGAGRREQKTRQPTGGRGNQGGLRIGEMERDAIVGHGISDFTQETYLKRADHYEAVICNGCGTTPIFNEGQKLFICPMCDGPVKFLGDSTATMEILPPNKRSITTYSKVQMPYALKLLDQELSTFLNMGMRVLTAKDVKRLRGPAIKELTDEQVQAALSAPLPERVVQELEVPEFVEPEEEQVARPEDLAALGAVPGGAEEEEAGAAAGAAEAVAAPPPPLQPVAAPPANGLPTVTLGPPATAAATAVAVGAPAGVAVAPEAGANALEEVDLNALPAANATVPAANATVPAAAAAAAAPPPAAAPPAGSVNVQTNQPVLVVPVNVAQAAPAEPVAQYVPPAAPGAPPTIAVDTSRPLEGVPGLPGAGAGAARPNRSGSANRRGASPGGAAAAAPAGPVMVNKLGAEPRTEQGSAPNVRVNVNKVG